MDSASCKQGHNFATNSVCDNRDAEGIDGVGIGMYREGFYIAD